MMKIAMIFFTVCAMAIADSICVWKICDKALEQCEEFTGNHEELSEDFIRSLWEDKSIRYECKPRSKQIKKK